MSSDSDDDFNFQSAETVAVKSVEISGENTVEVEGEIQLSAKVLPENAENTTITWTLISAGEDAENPVISLDEKTGLVKGLAAGVAVVRASAGGVSSEFEIKVISFTSIEVTNLPTKTEYGLGEVLSKEGMVITAKYSDDSEKVIASDDEKLEIVFDSSVPGEEVLVTVKYGEFSDTFTVVVHNKKVVSVEITAEPTKKSYYIGETLDLTGLTLKAVYDNSDVLENITSGFETSGFDSSSAAESQKITVTYGGKSAEFSVSIKADSVTEITAVLNEGVVYKVGENVAPKASDVIVTAKWESGKADSILASDSYTVSPASLTVNDTKLTVTHTESGKTAEVAITVTEVKINKVAQFTAALVEGKSYKEGDTVSASDLVVKAKYEDETEDTLASSQFDFAPVSALTASDKKITVTVTDAALPLVENVSKTVEIPVSVARVYSKSMTLTFDADYNKKVSDWSGVPVRTNGNACAKVTRSESSKAGYLGRKFWLVDGIYAEFTGSGLGYTNSAADATHESVDFLKAVESEAITGPFKLTVKTNTKEREFKIFVSADKDSLWSSEPKLSEKLSANSGAHTIEYDGTDSVYIGIGTLPAEDKTVYTSISSIILESYAEIPADTWPATGIAFTNAEIADSALTLTKDAIGAEGFQLAAKVSPDYAEDKTFTFTASGSKVHVSDAGLVTIDSDINANETITVTVNANGGTNVSANLSLTVKAVVEDSDKVALTKTELAAALEKTGEGAFSYGNSSTVVSNANSFVEAQTFTYSDVLITPVVNAETGDLTFTLAKGNESETVIVGYTEVLAKAAVADAKDAIEALSAYKWNTDAAATKSALDAAISVAGLVDVEVSTVTGENDDGLATVTVTVKNKLTGSGESAISVSDSALVLEAPRFEIVEENAKKYLKLTARTYEYQFDYASLEATTGDNAWSSLKDGVKKTDRAGKTKFTTKFEGTVTKSGAGTISLNVSHVAYADIYVYNSNTARDVSFKLNSKSEKVGVGKDTEVSGNVIANTDGEVVYRMVMTDIDSINTIVIQGEGNDVYPLGIVLHAPDGEATGLTLDANLPSASNDVKIAATVSGSGESASTVVNSYTVSGKAVFNYSNNLLLQFLLYNF